MTKQALEVCIRCGEYTGKAGSEEDSIYCDACGMGPFCSECVEEFGGCPYCGEEL